MKGRSAKLEIETSKDSAPAQELGPGCAEGAAEDIDLSLLEDSLAKTAWERMLANDDALRFADSLRAAMEKRSAKSERTDAQTH